LKEYHKKPEPNPRLGSRILDLRTTQALARKEYTYTFNISCRVCRLLSLSQTLEVKLAQATLPPKTAAYLVSKGNTHFSWAFFTVREGTLSIHNTTAD
jgi:hypothetical protein